jgi:hypothetical protein
MIRNGIRYQRNITANVSSKIRQRNVLTNLTLPAHIAEMQSSGQK